MNNIPVYDIKGKVAGKATLDATYFNGKINKALLHQTVLMYLANLRKGCASTKTRSKVRGGGRKPWRQKGTGRARVGSIRSPLWRGVGVIFGPHTRKYTYKLSKNIKHLALKMSLNAKIKDNEFILLDSISQDQLFAKTKEFAAFLVALKAKDKSLVVIEKYNPRMLRVSRNIPGVKVSTFNNITAFDVLKHKKIIFSKQAIENLVKLRKE